MLFYQISCIFIRKPKYFTVFKHAGMDRQAEPNNAYNLKIVEIIEAEIVNEKLPFRRLRWPWLPSSTWLRKLFPSTSSWWKFVFSNVSNLGVNDDLVILQRIWTITICNRIDKMLSKSVKKGPINHYGWGVGYRWQKRLILEKETVLGAELSHPQLIQSYMNIDALTCAILFSPILYVYRTGVLFLNVLKLY